ncbi:hypothetical protein TrCOL_g11104 [Triparma columacea]|uniref:Replication stress response regulator SDE2 n=1 Tax=Triparma columacea TaxID=722753 RepID=A0A9W7GIY0_9STRA|nr:hypothetical protein TrCOL_g11104 [Triparma columacea]
MAPQWFIRNPFSAQNHSISLDDQIELINTLKEQHVHQGHRLCGPLIAAFRGLLEDNGVNDDLSDAFISSGIKWAVHRYPNDTTFFEPQLVAPLMGGKGGFGALLKAVGKRAGKKKTTDFGACRDLNGRRLRHVNDEIKLERWRREQERKKDKLPAPSVEDSITDSGIDNWHLGVPMWSEGVTNKEKYKNKKRKYNERRREESEAERLEREKVERRNEEQRKVNEYAKEDSKVGLESGELAAMLRVEKIRKKIKEGKLKKLFSEVPGSNVTWGKGGLVAGAGGTGKDDCCFSTVYLIPPQTPAVTGRYYYEVVCEMVDKDGADIPLQIGYLTPTSLPDPKNQDGVGDVDGSVGFDGGRGLLFVDGLEKEEDGALVDDEGAQEGEIGRISWEKNDIVGVIYDAGERSVQYTLNGSPLPRVKAEGVGVHMVVGVSVNPGGEVRVRIGDEEMEYLPEGCAPVGDLLMKVGGGEGNGGEGGKKRKLGKEEEEAVGKPAGKKAATPTTTATTATTATTTTTTMTTSTTSKGTNTSTIASAAAPASRSPVTLDEIKNSYTEESLAALPLDTLKVTLQALGLKAGGSAAERANRLWAVKDMKREDIPGKMRDKKVFDAVTRIIESKGKW